VGLKKQKAFIMVPIRILTLGLDAYEIAVFCALKKFSDKNGSKIFPSYKKLMSMLSMSRGRLWKCLNTLKQCNVIVWEGGHTGKSNYYDILGEGNWTKKYVDKYVDKSKQVVHQTNYPSSPGERGVFTRRTPSISNNYIQSTIAKADFIGLIKNLKEEK